MLRMRIHCRHISPRLIVLLAVAAVSALARVSAAVTLRCPDDTVPRVWTVAVKSNLLQDAAVMPGLGVEVALGERWSAAVEGTYIWVKNYRRDRHWRVEGGELHLRRWFGRRCGWPLLSGHHIGLYGQLYTYQLQLCDSHGFMSGTPGQDLGGHPAWGAGVEYGYSLPVSRRFSVDFGLGLGYMHCRVNRYGRSGCKNCTERGGYALQRSYCRNWFGPTRAEVSLVWRIGPQGGDCKDAGGEERL